MKKVSVAEFATTAHKGNHVLKMEITFMDTEKLTDKHSIDISKLSVDEIDAEVDKKAIGAVWVRIMNDYGHIDNNTPSFAISLYKNYRGFEKLKVILF